MLDQMLDQILHRPLKQGTHTQSCSFIFKKQSHASYNPVNGEDRRVPRWKTQTHSDLNDPNWKIASIHTRVVLLILAWSPNVRYHFPGSYFVSPSPIHILRFSDSSPMLLARLSSSWLHSKSHSKWEMSKVLCVRAHIDWKRKLADNEEYSDVRPNVDSKSEPRGAESEASIGKSIMLIWMLRLNSPQISLIATRGSRRHFFWMLSDR
jgi:hypothetical protein